MPGMEHSVPRQLHHTTSLRPKQLPLANFRPRGEQSSALWKNRGKILESGQNGTFSPLCFVVKSVRVNKVTNKGERSWGQ